MSVGILKGAGSRERGAGKWPAPKVVARAVRGQVRMTDFPGVVGWLKFEGG